MPWPLPMVRMVRMMVLRLPQVLLDSPARRLLPPILRPPGFRRPLRAGAPPPSFVQAVRRLLLAGLWATEPLDELPPRERLLGGPAVCWSRSCVSGRASIFPSVASRIASLARFLVGLSHGGFAHWGALSLGGDPVRSRSSGRVSSCPRPRSLPPRRPVVQVGAVLVPADAVVQVGPVPFVRFPGVTPRRWPLILSGTPVVVAAGAAAPSRRVDGGTLALAFASFPSVPIGAATGLHARFTSDVRARLRTPIPSSVDISVGAATGFHARFHSDVRARLQTPIPFVFGMSVGAATGIHARCSSDVRARLQTPIPFNLGISVGAATGIHARFFSDVRARLHTPIQFAVGIAVGAATGIHARFHSDVRARLQTPIPFTVGIAVGAATGFHAR